MCVSDSAILGVSAPPPQKKKKILVKYNCMVIQAKFFTFHSLLWVSHSFYICPS